MKRSEALQPLSHDHHQGLAFVARLRRAGRAGEEPAAWAEAVGAFWRDYLVPHFDEEETWVLPVLEEGAAPLAEQMLHEHRRIKAAVGALTTAPASWEGENGLAAFADMLAAHIRFEEREAFPAAERLADPDTLATLGEKIANTDRRHA